MFSVIDPATILAYQQTEYRVLATPPFILRIGTKSPHLIGMHDRHKVKCSAFFTAWNPYSRLSDQATNRAMQQDLTEKLTHRGHVFISGLGQHPSNQWPAEESLLILGIDLEAAKNLAGQYEQNAFVWNSEDGIPQLILLR